MGILIAAAAILLGYGGAYAASSQVRYLSRAGIEETRILMHRVPISHLANDSAAPPTLRAQARLVIAVRGYAVGLGLEAKETYTTFSDVGRDTLLLVLTASPRTCICAVTWKYPIVGKVPYKGFFNFGEARQAADHYAALGYDVNLRPSDAFSTLGWFNDPLMSTALGSDSMELAATVFHEIAHNTLWVKGATAFNESFAQWVGYHAARDFFLARHDTLDAIRAVQRWHDEQELGIYYGRLIERLDSLYAMHLPESENDSGRVAVAVWSRDTLVNGIGPVLRTYSIGHPSTRPINNATLIGVMLYRTHLDLFDRWYDQNHEDLTAAVFRLRALMQGVQGDDAFRVLRAALDMTPGTAAPADST